jgi:hypothetical protein
MGTEVQDVVCAFVREIIEARTGELVRVTDRPEVDLRSGEVVEQRWESASLRYAIEHTRVESYDGQIGNEARLSRLIVPVRAMLAGRLPGTYVLAVLLRETNQARIKYADAHEEIVRLTLDAAPILKNDETVVLPSKRLPFSVRLHRRHGNGSQAFVHCLIDGDGEALRLERMRRALADKCPKLKEWCADGRTSILVLEANDIQLSNCGVAFEAFRQAVAERDDQPDIVVFVETDGGPMYGWIFKEGNRFGDDVPMRGGHHCYTEGQIYRS